MHLGFLWILDAICITDDCTVEFAKHNRFFRHWNILLSTVISVVHANADQLVWIVYRSKYSQLIALQYILATVHSTEIIKYTPSRQYCFADYDRSKVGFLECHG